jgi:hypothetical protein
MRLHTFQPLFVYERLLAGHAWTANPFAGLAPEGVLALVEQDYQRAYQWLGAQMLARGIEPQSPQTQWPIWAWSQWNGLGHIDPDLDDPAARSFALEQTQAVLCLDIDPSRVLLSDYDAWHGVLNEWFIAPEADVDEFDSRCKASDPEWRFGSSPRDPDLLREMQESWQTVFDPALCSKVLEIPPERSIVQATFWELRPEDVVAVRALDSQGPPRALPWPSKSTKPTSRADPRHRATPP